MKTSKELQEIDCNCNDCKFMVRDLDRRNKSLEFHKQIQGREQFDSTFAAIHYGNCAKLKKPVSFIPNVCQIETQKCFEHRKN